MPPPKLPVREADRLAALDASGVLENGPEDELDAIVREASELFATPIAAVTLLTRTEQRFMASVGLGVQSTSRDQAFCGYAILETEPLVVLDARADQRFVDNPLVTSAPSIRFYAGVPVVGSEGQPFGALCVIDTLPREAVDLEMMESLRDMADMVSNVLSRPRRRP